MISILALKQLLEQFMMMLFIPKGVMIYYIYSQISDGVYKNFRGKHYNEKEVELAKKSVKSICLQFRIYRSKNNLNEIVEAFGLEKDPAYSQESAR